MQDISGHGIKVRVVASSTYPAGITLTEFADDADPLDLPSQEIQGKGMGVNGDLVTWSRAIPTDMTINLIPGGEDDLNMGVLLEANRVGKGRASARDIIQLTVMYPDGRTITLSPGKLTNGVPGRSVASAGRQKSKAYTFTFENSVRA